MNTQTQTPSFKSTTVEQLRAVVTEQLQIDVQQLQRALGSLIVSTSHEMECEADVLSVFDADVLGRGCLVLLADRIPAGQEAECLAGELARRCGSGVAITLLGEVAALQGVGGDLDAVAEWVGLHHGRNFDREPEVKRREWIERYMLAQLEGEELSVPAGAEKPLGHRLVTGEWPHLFGPGLKETRCRIVLDVEQSRVLAAQEWTGLKFEDVRGERLANLNESVIGANEAHDDPQDWGLTSIDELPAWAVPARTADAVEQPEDPEPELLVVTRAELEVLHAAVSTYQELLSSPTSADRAGHGDEWADREMRLCDALLKRLVRGVELPEKLEAGSAGQTKTEISSSAMAEDPLIVVELIDEDRHVQQVEFRASSVLAHHGEKRTWAEVGADPKHQHLQHSMLEDYVLWSRKRAFGDMHEYYVNVISMGSESPAPLAAAGTAQAPEDHSPSPM